MEWSSFKMVDLIWIIVDLDKDQMNSIPDVQILYYKRQNTDCWQSFLIFKKKPDTKLIKDHQISLIN